MLDVPTRAAGLASVWICIIVAIGCAAYGFVDHRFFFGGALVFVAMWCYLSVRWVDQHDPLAFGMSLPGEHGHSIGTTDTHSHWLILEDGPANAEWLLERDLTTLILTDPDGNPVLQTNVAEAHRLVDLHALYFQCKISLRSSNGSVVFRRNSAAQADLRELVETGVASDAEYRKKLRRPILPFILAGVAMFFVAGGLFGLYCWYASWAPEPPPGHWIRWFGWLIHGILLLLLVAALLGPVAVYHGIQQWVCVRRVERAIAARGLHARRNK
jgi:hypothetical protein